LKDITQYETNSGQVQATVSTSEIIPDNYKGKPFQMFAGATIMGNVTINFPN